MNRKEKDIIRAYMKAVKQASHLESRVRIMLVGDRGTGGYNTDTLSREAASTVVYVHAILQAHPSRMSCCMGTCIGCLSYSYAAQTSTILLLFEGSPPPPILQSCFQADRHEHLIHSLDVYNP